MTPLLAQAEAGGSGIGEILLGILVLAAMAWVGARIITRRGGPRGDV